MPTGASATTGATVGDVARAAHLGHLGLDRGPQRVADGADLGTSERVDDHDTVDHVGQHRHPGPPGDPHGHDGALGAGAPDGAVDLGPAGRAAKARHLQATPARRLAERAGGGGEAERGSGHAGHPARGL